MDRCNKCMRKNVCQYEVKDECRNFIDSDLYEILQGLSPEQIVELMKFADSLRENNK